MIRFFVKTFVQILKHRTQYVLFLSLFWFVFFSTPCLAQFSYEQFLVSDLADFQLVQNATLEGTKIRLTLNSGGQVGALWYKIKQQIDEGFETEFTFQITDIGGWGGGDGFAFVIQNYTLDAIGEGGGDIGYTGIPNCVAIEFDTWANSGDPNSNHIAVHTQGTSANTSDKSALIGYTTDIAPLDDGALHHVKIAYTPPLLEIYLDSLNSAPALSVTLDLSDTLQLDEGRAWIGFTAGTGAAYEKHYILSWKYVPASSVGIQEKLQNQIPRQFALLQNYPNPFNPTTIITYELPKTSRVSLTIYNLLGQKVRTLINTHQPAGQYQVQWDGKDDFGNPLASGIYLYELKARTVLKENFIQVKKLVFIK
ncbi:Por secretion system C-terminal sorting domain-containing protein [Caldithrix abyssi DSM 13497]|uniref:Por secretion system C-terminal sorting domain-containing protein n=1 Tax=Caldithrix abyssi DSM 13497 TaxID=880073 RepID=A0A1J1CB83_CALAY|nr:Por secretion system C-terminal sorting domain-containing protein [Caldithrix abyssi DSM 13497]